LKGAWFQPSNLCCDKPVPKFACKLNLYRCVQGLCINEFEGLAFDANKATDQASGAQVLDRLSFGAADGNSVQSAAVGGGVLYSCVECRLYSCVE
jgi:hypothetical protein